MTKETIVSLEGNDLAEMQAAVEQHLGEEWTVVRVDADLSLIDVRGGFKPEWLPGRWRARFTAMAFEDQVELGHKEAQ